VKIIKENIKLSDLNTFRTGGNARFFCEVESEGELIEVLKFARKNNLKFFVIGNGSNLLISDEDYSGLVIKICIKGMRIESIEDKFSTVSSGAGESFDDLINFAIKSNLSGIENLWNVPGTVGASAVQNIGAYGTEVKDFIISVEAINTNTFKKFTLDNKECIFEYRESIFKKNKNLIITKVFFKLNNSFKPNLDYVALKEYFLNKKKPNINEIIKAITEIRKNKLPDWKVLGTAGSFFKNPVIKESKYKELKLKYLDLPSYRAESGFVKIPLGFVIDKICGLRGYRVGQVGLYEKQSLVIINYGRATFDEINIFAKDIERKVYDKTKIKIEREVENIF
jgi:UDP-N-acetylmuramate dehydrogenase